MSNLSFEFSLIADLIRRLNRPLTVFDLEGTGFLGSAFGITEVAAFSLMPDGRSFLYGGLVNPENPITAKARLVTGINQRMVADKENWGAKYARHFDRISREHIMAGFNIKTFDVPAVLKQNQRYGVDTPQFASVVDVRRFYLKAAGVKGQTGKLEPVAASYGVAPKGNAHRATADVILTVELLEALLRTHGEDVFMELLTGTATRNRLEGNSGALLKDLLEEVQTNGFRSIGELALVLGVQESDLDYPLCRAIDTGALDAFQFSHAPTRSWLRKAVPTLFGRDGQFDGKLKPLFEALVQQQPADVKLTYLQLRIGLLDAGYVWGMLKPLPAAA